MATTDNAAFEFDARTFVQRGYESASGDFSDEDRKGISSLRALYPELGRWGDFAIGCAFGAFCQDFLLVSWADWMFTSRDENFLNYCCWRQTRGAWTQEFDQYALSRAGEWKQ